MSIKKENKAEPDVKLRDVLAEKGREIYEKFVEFYNSRGDGHNINLEANTLIDQCLDDIAKANGKEKKLRYNLAEAESTGISFVLDYYPNAIIIEEVCTVCNRKKNLNCYKKHFKIDNPILNDEGRIGPYSIGQTSHAYLDKNGLFTLEEYVMQYSLKEDESNSTLGNHRKYMIIAKEEENKKFENNITLSHGLQNFGLSFFQKVCLPSKTERVKNFKNHFEGKRIYRIKTEAYVEEIIENNEKHLRVRRPNSETILKKIMDLNGLKYKILNKAFIVLRIVTDMNQKKFFEPVYVQMKSFDSFKATDIKEQVIVRVYYITSDDENKEYIKIILVNAKNLKDCFLSIAAEHAERYSQDMLPVVDRKLALKINFQKQEEVEKKKEKSKKKSKEKTEEMNAKREEKSELIKNMKEYVLPTDCVQNVNSLVRIIEKNSEVRFRTKSNDGDNSEKYKNCMIAKLHDLDDVKMTINLTSKEYCENIEMPNVYMICGKILEKMIEKQKTKEQLNENEENELSNNNLGVNANNVADFDFLYYITLWMVYEINWKGKEEKNFDEENLELINVRENYYFKKCKNPNDLTVSEIKSKNKNYDQVKGVYEINKINETTKIQPHSSLIVLGEKAKKNPFEKDILKYVLLDENGSILYDIELKTNLTKVDASIKKVIKPKKNDPISFQFEHERFLCDSLLVEEDELTIKYIRLIMSGEKTGIIAEVIEPNPKTILAYRMVDGYKEKIPSYIRDAEDIKKHFKDFAKDTPQPFESFEKNTHSETCCLQAHGKFGIKCTIEIKEFKDNRINTIETRQEYKIVILECKNCEDATVLLNSYDSFTDSCVFTASFEKLSPYDYLSAVKQLERKAETSKDKNQTIVHKRFKHRLQRSINI